MPKPSRPSKAKPMPPLGSQELRSKLLRDAVMALTFLRGEVIADYEQELGLQVLADNCERIAKAARERLLVISSANDGS